MSSISGYVGLIGIDSEGGRCAYFCLVNEPGALDFIKVGDRTAWFCVELKANGRTVDRTLLQEIYLAQSAGRAVKVYFDASRPDAGMLADGCYHATWVQILPPGTASEQPAHRMQQTETAAA